MRLFVVEARNFDIKTSLFLLLEALSPEDARKRAQEYYRQEGWAPAAIFEVQSVARPRNGVRLLYRQRWDALQVGTEEPEQWSAPFINAVDGLPVAIQHQEALTDFRSAPDEAGLLTEPGVSEEESL